ncbi:MAG: homocysteine S-methyltransferase family protein [Ignavibacteria bacterium]|nr:homocysteine S-methyltransferase family protein [Ignavibacteria bacterium]
MNNFYQLLKERVLIFDGAMGTNLQAQNLTSDDFGGKEYEGCNEYLIITKPSAVEKVHIDFLEAGADIIETNTFGSNEIVLAEYNLQKHAYEISKKAAELAKKLALDFSTNDKPRFVAGSIGPGTKLPSLGHVTFRELEKSYYPQISGLVDGGVDILCIETCQDLLQIKSVLSTVEKIFNEKKIKLPVIVSITIETTGTMLIGTDISAALTTLEPYEIIDVIGMNCATGPKEMSENVRYLCQNSPKPVFVMPNAGIPENINGRACYHLSPDELVQWLHHFVKDLGVNIVGGCCGTTKEHIKKLVDNLSGLKVPERNWSYQPSVSSNFISQPLRLDPAPVLVGERCNANGSKQFREYLLKDDYEGMLQVARDQIKEGAHMLDICVAYVGRDEKKDMIEFVKRLNTQITLPIMIDSTEYEVIEAALEHYAGRCVINSVNLEDGEERISKVFPLAKKFGAAVIALTIDEEGMAKTAEKKLSIAKRIRNLAVNKYSLREEDLIFDPLTFTLGSGDEEFRRSAIETLEAIKLIKKEIPKSFTILGISNVSFGLNVNARHALNSVFLYHAVQAGLDLAIVHASKIMPLNKIDERGKQLCEELIFDKRKYEFV